MRTTLAYFVWSFIVMGLSTLYIGIGFELQKKTYPREIPAFAFPDLNGTVFRKEDLAKSIQTIFIYASPDCIHCSNATKIIAENAKAFDSCEVIMIFPSDAIEVEKFMSENPGLETLNNLRILLDPFKHFPQLFGPSNYPSFFLYNKKGFFIKKIEGLSDINALKQPFENED